MFSNSLIALLLAFLVVTLGTPSLPETVPVFRMAHDADAGVGAGARPMLANKLGVHLLLDDGRRQWPVERWDEHLAQARAAVGEWGYVIQLVRADDLDPARWQVFMDLCARYHLTPVLRLATTFDREERHWHAPVMDDDGSYHEAASRYATFIAPLHWPTDEHHVIIGNETNRGDEWGGRPDPAQYAQFLIDVAAAVKQRDSGARILNAGLDLYAPNSGSAVAWDGKRYIDAERFLEGMVQAYPEVFRSVDVWSSHSYPLGPFSEGPWQQRFAIDLLNDAVRDQAAPPAHIYNRGINGYEWELWKLATFGVTGLPVMITETGWRHAESVDPAAQDTGEHLPSGALAGVFFDLALRGNDGRYPELPQTGWTPWLDDARVIGVMAFALNGHPADWGHTNLIQVDGEGHVDGTYPIFDALKAGNAQWLARPD